MAVVSLGIGDVLGQDDGGTMSQLTRRWANTVDDCPPDRQVGAAATEHMQLYEVFEVLKVLDILGNNAHPNPFATPESEPGWTSTAGDLRTWS